MATYLVLKCGGCDAQAEAGPLVKRFHGLGNKDYGFGTAFVDDPEPLAPEGWVMFDPFTYATYCPTCWAGIIDPAAVEPAAPAAGTEGGA